MTKQVQRRRGTSTQHTSFTGAEGEISVNTTNKSIHVHDGTTAGGVEAARADLANVSDTSLNNALSGNTLASLTITSADINGGTIDGTTIGGTSPAAVTTTSLVATSADINGGTIDGTTIGGSSAAAITGTTITATGDVTIADKIVHAGDTNTAIRFPAADTVTVETDGTERLRVDSSGNVGIGTTSPSALLHVLSTGDTVARVTSGDANTAVLDLGKTSDTDGGRIAYDSGNNLLLHTASTERMRIDASGNVGIGTSSPGARLEVSGETRIYPSSGAANLRFGSGGSEKAKLAVDTSSNMIFETAGTERLRIDASGNLGLGVTPSAWSASHKAMDLISVGIMSGLNANSSANYFNNSYFNGTNFIYKGNGSAARYEQAAGAHTFYTAPSGTAGNAITFTQAMTLDAGGKLSVGTTGAFGILNLKEGAVSLEANTDATSANWLAYNRGSSAYATLGLRAADVRFLISDTERARIDTSGYLLVGATSSVGGGAVRFQLGSASAATSGFLAKSTSSSLTLYASSTSASYQAWASGTSMIFGEGPDDLSTFTERARIDSSGNLLVGLTSTSSPAATVVNRQAVTGSPIFTWTNNANNSGHMHVIAGGGSGITADGFLAFGSNELGNNTFTERARINTSGNLGIGTSTPGHRLDVSAGQATVKIGSSTTSAGNEPAILLEHAGNNSFQIKGGSDLIFSSNAGTNERMRISSDGQKVHSYDAGATTKEIFNWSNNTTGMSFRSAGVERGNIYFLDTGVAFNTTSDYRLKEDWQPMAGASERVLALKPVNFAWKVNGSRVDGFLAHEAQSVVPEAVTGEKDAVDADGNPKYQGIDQSKLVPLLTAALQEALTEIASLKARLDAANL